MAGLFYDSNFADDGYPPDMERKVNFYLNAIRRRKNEHNKFRNEISNEDYSQNLPNLSMLEELVDFCIEKELFFQALEFNNLWLEYLPDSWEAWFKKGVIHISLEQMPESSEALDRALSLNPYDNEIILKKAWVLDQIGSSDEAYELIENILKVDPFDEEALYHKAIILQERADYDASIEIFTFLTSSETIGPDCLNEAAYSYYLKGDFKNALEYYYEYTDSDPLNDEAWLNLGIVQFDMCHFYKSIECFDTSIALRQDNFLVWLSKGNAYAAVGRLKDAIESYREALKYNRADLEIWFNLASVLGDSGNFVEAIQCFDQALEIEPCHYQSWFGKGLCHDALENYNMALENYDKALGLHSEFAEIWIAKADAYFNLYNGARNGIPGTENYLQKSFECYWKFLELKPENRESHIEFANLLIEAKEYNLAEIILRFIILNEPTWHISYYIMSRLQLLKGNKRTSIKYLALALKLEPSVIDSVKIELNNLYNENDVEKFCSLMNKLAEII